MINWQAGYAERCKSGLGGSLAETCPRKREKAPRRLPYPTFYYKAEMVLPIKGIRTEKVRRRRVFVYIMHEERSIGLPSASYVRVCREGYQAFGFDENFLMGAIRRSVEGLK